MSRLSCNGGRRWSVAERVERRARAARVEERWARARTSRARRNQVASRRRSGHGGVEDLVVFANGDSFGAGEKAAVIYGREL